jgi:hypothetical protein
MTEKQGQIAHIDRNPENNDPNNLAFLCLEHHDRYDSKPSQSKGLTHEEVRRYREELLHALHSSRLLHPDLSTYTVVPMSTSRPPKSNYPDFLGVSKLPDEEPRNFLPETSAESIVQAFLRIPPLSRGAITDEAYRGRWMRSAGVIGTIREGDQCYSVTIAADGGGIVNLTFPTTWRADVESLREGDHIRFEGQIRHVSEVNVELVKPSISMHLRLLRPKGRA